MSFKGKMKQGQYALLTAAVLACLGATHGYAAEDAGVGSNIYCGAATSLSRQAAPVSVYVIVRQAIVLRSKLETTPSLTKRSPRSTACGI